MASGSAVRKLRRLQTRTSFTNTLPGPKVCRMHSLMKAVKQQRTFCATFTGSISHIVLQIMRQQSAPFIRQFAMHGITCPVVTRSASIGCMHKTNIGTLFSTVLGQPSKTLWLLPILCHTCKPCRWAGLTARTHNSTNGTNQNKSQIQPAACVCSPPGCKILCEQPAA